MSSKQTQDETFREMLGLINQYVWEDTNMSLEDIEQRAQEYYEASDLSGSQYDKIQREMFDLE